MALRSAATRCKTIKRWSFRSAVVFIMKTTDFTMKKCDFYDPSALTNLPLVAVSSLQLSRLLKILNLDYALCSGGETCSNVLIIIINNGCSRVKRIIPLPWDNLIMLGNEVFNVVQPISKQPIRNRKPKSSGQNEYILSVEPHSSTVGPIEPDRIALPVCRHEGTLTSGRPVSKGGAVLMSATCTLLLSRIWTR
ncbi:hypothetical protein T05_10198 [Trichinella murrelli]|uniref:Uncharacterized protein n=1 Tax=Trichinella murrelli TaxID=144512 RepID=A0A0V0TQA4_9BILA|nr:hypothetical protein T05_10198 [Trichinella murrelli]